MIRPIAALVALALLFGCAEPVPDGSSARILVLGDSMMASNRATGQSVADVIETALQQKVIDRSVVAARYFYALPISGAAGLRLTAQYRPRDWDWVILNGGGNDLLFGCGCGFCDGVLDRLVSQDGRAGTIPAYVARIRQSGARVIYVGYLRNPGTGTPIKGCGPAGNELDRRLTRMARFDAGVTFLPMADLVPHGDTSFHQLDRIHPSVIGSRGIGTRILEEIQRANTATRPRP
ncbi:MAG: SGNH/GDSL hydrolase family protein [Paracoccaceae bacterium]